MNLFSEISDEQKKDYLANFKALEISRISIKNNIETLKILSSLNIEIK
jgi:hypothetical protein